MIGPGVPGVVPRGEGGSSPLASRQSPVNGDLLVVSGGMLGQVAVTTRRETEGRKRGK